MKICFVAPDSVTIARGGPYNKIMEFKKHFENKGHEVTLFNMWQDSDSLNEFDIVHIVTANFATYGFARSLKQNNINFVIEPIVFSNHSNDFISFVTKFEEVLRPVLRGVWLDYGMMKDICNWSEFVLPNTSDEGKIISKGLGIDDSKTIVNHNGVSEKFLNADPSLFIEKYGIKDFVLNVGHVGPARKNIVRLAKACSELDVPCVIIGKMHNGGEADEFNSIREQSKNIIYIEELPNDGEMLVSAYAAAKTFVLPSLYETPGIAALEAGLAGANVVITERGGTKEYFGKYANYVNPKSVSDIKNKIEKSLITDKNDDLKNHIKRNYLWEAVADKALMIYDDIIRKRK